ncbi:MAG TPA: EamA family transporter [Actinomycetota bacterium]|nr:EamA family transporter [Actinomycetota bacterium]
MTRPADTTTERAVHSPAVIWGPLLTVYLIWGTTYLGIRVVNETMPPLLSAGFRFVVAGAVLYAWAIRRGDRQGDRPTLIQWRSALIVGALLLVGGNGGVVWAERTVPSGIVALIIALVPLWMALFDRIIVRRPLGARTVVGLVLGFAGTALLVGQGVDAGSFDLRGAMFAVGASIAWATGSLYSRNAPLPKRPFVGNGMQQLLGGALLLLIGTLIGELGDIHPKEFSTASLLALGYLIVFGSLIAFTSYLWLLRNARTTLVATYAYVTPVVAVFLGWLILDEPVTLRTIVAAAVIVVAVALIVSSGGTAREPEPVPRGAEREDAA